MENDVIQERKRNKNRFEIWELLNEKETCMCLITFFFSIFHLFTAMETEVPPVPVGKKEPSRRAAAQKKPLSTVTEISDDDDEKGASDEDFELEEEAIPEVGKTKR